MDCHIVAIQFDHRPHLHVGHMISEDDITQRPDLGLGHLTEP